MREHARPLPADATIKQVRTRAGYSASHRTGVGEPLTLSVAAIRAAPWMPFAAGADLALSKIEAALPAERVKDLRRFMRRILIGDPSFPATVSHADTVDPRLLPAFEQALTQSRVL